MEGWIKLYRKLLKSDMYRSLNSKQRDVLITCLLMANHDQKKWEWGGKIHKCKPGQFVTSLDNITKNCASDVKVQSVRTALLKLEKWQFLTGESTKTGRVITILKWGDYQEHSPETNKETNKHLTKNQQRTNKQLTTNKNVKNVKNEKKLVNSSLSLTERQNVFYNELKEFVGKYSKTMVRSFYDYWSEPNRSKTKMRYEIEKTWETSRRLANWNRRSDNYDKGKSTPSNNNKPVIHPMFDPLVQKQDEENIKKYLEQ